MVIFYISFALIIKYYNARLAMRLKYLPRCNRQTEGLGFESRRTGQTGLKF